jgi:agmatine/peptidylarginine deiminase
VARRLAAEGLAPDAVEYVESSMMTMWVRDWGPIGVERPGGGLQLVDPHYEGNARNPGDDRAGADIAVDLGLPVRTLPLTLEGGDVLSNGRGLGLTSRRLVQRNVRERGYDARDVAELLRSHLGFEDWFPLPSLVGEPTGHVDMFVTFVDPLTVVVGRYDPLVDPTNAALLDTVAAALNGFVTRAGTLRVERVTMPARPDAIWRSYTNVVYANDAVLVPQYPDHDPELDAAARRLYRRLLPGRKIVGIDSSELIRRNGALHCVTLNVKGRSRSDSTSS